ncbi:MAG: hypothetical protein AAGJ52_06115, partial [Pseudomonadota bacterium]
MRRLITVFLLLLMVAGAAGAWQWQQWRQFLDAPVNPDTELALWVAPGSTFISLINKLEALGLA